MHRVAAGSHLSQMAAEGEAEVGAVERVAREQLVDWRVAVAGWAVASMVVTEAARVGGR